ncbi:phage replisome organizer N-terminal domain-containing protein [Clostridium gasigenes]|uniref:phage replisome organizer N-terminal domain-containing protein n=1 Tax=Clostridium gasigenes TaxID=94869 RepID=UPI001624E079|nr:phage replisome organizer N-terminal domain-containing protein [Clostridium gasigenes]MBB6625224.1 phage replisome organizer N-terminal domain-containing protein [Clostridium gasigenes]
MAKKYYWLKLKEDFFRQKEIKKLRKIAGGDTFTIIYLKMQLLSLKNEGALYYEGLEENFYEQLSLEIDEDSDNVKITVLFLLQNKLIEEVDEDKYLLIKAAQSIGKESESAERVRKHREGNKTKSGQKSLQSNNQVTKCNTETETELELETELEIQQQLDKKITNILKEFSKEEVKSIIKYCKENTVPVDVVVEKWEIVKNLKSVKNRVGALIAAISNDWDKPKGHTGNTFVYGCSSRDYDHDDIEKKLLGWDKDED